MSLCEPKTFKTFLTSLRIENEVNYHIVFHILFAFITSLYKLKISCQNIDTRKVNL